MKKFPIFIGHRGTNYLKTENTLPAIEKAISAKFDFLEIDVQQTKDNELVIFHDSFLEKKTNGYGSIKDKFLNYFKNIVYKKTSIQIPSFLDFLDQYSYFKNYIIDLKNPGLGSSVIKLLNKKNIEDQCIIASKFIKDLSILKKTYTNIKICLWLREEELNFESFLRLAPQKMVLNLHMLGIYHSKINTEYFQFCKENKIISVAWGCYENGDPISNIKNVISKGIDAVLIDEYQHLQTIKDWIRG